MKSKLTEKQKRFCEEYLIDLNATQSAIRAGYSEKVAYSIGSENLKKPEIQNYITELLDSAKSTRIAESNEVMEYLTKGMRQELTEEVVVTEGAGEGVSEAKIVKKQISLKDSNKCAELLGKRYSLFSEKVEVSSSVESSKLNDILSQLQGDTK